MPEHALLACPARGAVEAPGPPVASAGLHTAADLWVRVAVLLGIVWALGPLSDQQWSRWAVAVALAVVPPLVLPLLGSWALAVGRRWAALEVATTALAVGALLGPLPAPLAALWLAWAVPVAVAAGRQALDRRGAATALRAVAAVWLVPAGAYVVAGAAHAEPFGETEPFVPLAAVHFLLAGTALTTVAARLVDEVRPGARRVVAADAVVLQVGTGMVALGHLGLVALEAVGATLVAVAVAGLALVQWRAAPERPDVRRLLRWSSVLAVAPAALAVAFGWSRSTGGGGLPIGEMLTWHGAPNLLAWGVLAPAGLARWERPAVGLRVLGPPGAVGLVAWMVGVAPLVLASLLAIPFAGVGLIPLALIAVQAYLWTAATEVGRTTPAALGYVVVLGLLEAATAASISVTMGMPFGAPWVTRALGAACAIGVLLLVADVVAAQRRPSR